MALKNKNLHLAQYPFLQTLLPFMLWKKVDFLSFDENISRPNSKFLNSNSIIHRCSNFDNIIRTWQIGAQGRLRTHKIQFNVPGATEGSFNESDGQILSNFNFFAYIYVNYREHCTLFLCQELSYEQSKLKIFNQYVKNYSIILYSNNVKILVKQHETIQF